MNLYQEPQLKEKRNQITKELECKFWNFKETKEITKE